MSHITDARLQVKDLDALDIAADILGFVRLEQKTHAWYGRMVGDSEEGRTVARERGMAALGKCDFALRQKDHKQGDYEIGVVKEADGTFSLLYDSWGPGQRIEQKAGRNLSKLRQEYAVAVTQSRVTKTMARQGFRMTRENIGDGRVRLRLQRRTT
jgi:hypothetical protein